MNFYLSFLAYNCWRIIITAVIAYLLGSVNTAVIVTKIVTGGKKTSVKWAAVMQDLQMFCVP